MRIAISSMAATQAGPELFTDDGVWQAYSVGRSRQLTAVMNHRQAQAISRAMCSTFVCNGSTRTGHRVVYLSLYRSEHVPEQRDRWNE